jgi:hypothetical protein
MADPYVSARCKGWCGDTRRAGSRDSGTRGHGDLGTTQRYMHLSPAALDAAIRLLDSGAGGRTFGDIVEAASARSEIANI